MTVLRRGVVVLVVVALLRPQPLRAQQERTVFDMSLSEKVRELILTNPLDFEWDDLTNQVAVGIQPDTRWTQQDEPRDVQLVALVRRKGAEAERLTRRPTTVSAMIAENAGIPFLLPPPGKNHFPDRSFYPADVISLDATLDPASDTFLERLPEPGPHDAGVLILYTTFTDDALKDRVAVRPLVLTFRER